jgi:hypothetical protein
MRERLYTTIEDAYTHANRTLLQLLRTDQKLILRLRALRKYFFMSQASFITHFLDLAHSELKKTVRSASVSRLQSLLELSLGGQEGEGEGEGDLKVVLAKEDVYAWLSKVLQVNGAIDEGHAPPADQEETKKDKEEKKQFAGPLYSLLREHVLTGTSSHRRDSIGLPGQVPVVASDFEEDDLAVSAPLPLSSAPEKRRTITLFDVGRAQIRSLACPSHFFVEANIKADFPSSGIEYRRRGGRVRGLEKEGVRPPCEDARVRPACPSICGPRHSRAEREVVGGEACEGQDGR